MKNALLGLLAIPVIFALIALSNTTEACGGGGDASVTYLGENVTVPAHGYTVRSFEVSRGSDYVSFSEVAGGRMMVLTAQDMTNYTEGHSTEPIYDSANTSERSHMVLEKGKYWAVIENRASDEELNVRVDIESPRMLEKCIDPDTPISFMPGFQFELLGIAMVIGTSVATIMKRRMR